MESNQGMIHHQIVTTTTSHGQKYFMNRSVLLIHNAFVVVVFVCVCVFFFLPSDIPQHLVKYHCGVVLDTRAVYWYSSVIRENPT